MRKSSKIKRDKSSSLKTEVTTRVTEVRRKTEKLFLLSKGVQMDNLCPGACSMKCGIAFLRFYLPFISFSACRPRQFSSVDATASWENSRLASPIPYWVLLKSVLPELAPPSCGMTFGQFLRRGAVEVNRVMAKRLWKKACEGLCGRRREGWKASSAEDCAHQGVRDTGTGFVGFWTVPNVLRNAVTSRLGTKTGKENRRTTNVTGKKFHAVRILKNVPVQIVDRTVKLSFPFIEGSPYEVIIGDLTMESMNGVLRFDSRVALLIIAGDKIETAMERDEEH